MSAYMATVVLPLVLNTMTYCCVHNMGFMLMELHGCLLVRVC